MSRGFDMISLMTAMWIILLTYVLAISCLLLQMSVYSHLSPRFKIGVIWGAILLFSSLGFLVYFGC